MKACRICGLEQDSGELTLAGECALPLVRREACQGRMVANLRRALWAVRVLDAWAAHYGTRWQGGATTDQVNVCSCVLGATGLRVDFERERVYMNPTPDAARLAAAEAVLHELPAEVRAKLGERP